MPQTRTELIYKKIHDAESLKKVVSMWRLLSQKIVFTNGCFDIIHPGHIHTLAAAAGFGNKLIVGLNSDQSVRKIKKQGRPIQDEKSRALILASFSFVSAIVLFNEETPYEIIKLIQPDVLVKGGDYIPFQVVGADAVLTKGGSVEIIKFLEGYSTTSIEERIKNN